jgi:hypothetical protein
MKSISIAVVWGVCVATRLATGAPSEQAATEYDAGKRAYENCPAAEPGTAQWVERQHALRGAKDHFLKSYDLYRHSKTALFIAIIYGELSQKSEAKDYANRSLGGDPPLTQADAETAKTIREWATAGTSVGLTFYGGSLPPASIRPPSGNIR